MLYAIIACLVVHILYTRKFFPIPEILDFARNAAMSITALAAACATAGIVVGSLSLTGLGTVFTQVIRSISGGNIYLALIYTAVACIILGMGMPITAAYIVLSTLGAPVLVQMGLPPLTAHFFIFWFACTAPITPPVALASYAAASIAECDPWVVGMKGFRMVIPSFVIPFMFVIDPGLLMAGEFATTSYNLLTAVLGILCFCSAMQGYCFGPIPMWKRVLFVIPGFLLMIPGALTDAVGMLFLLGLAAPIAMRKFFSKKTVA